MHVINFLWLVILLHLQISLCLYVSGEEPPESLFMKELRRRGMTPTSLLEEKNKDAVREEIKFREEDGGWGYSRRNGITTGAETNLTGQREKSMALNSEGLEVGRSFCFN